MADKIRYEPITSGRIRTAEEMAREIEARAKRKEEEDQRKSQLLEEARQQAIKREDRDRKYSGQKSHPRTKRPKSIEVDGEEKPIEKALAEVPAQLDFEQMVRSSPLRERALAQSRTEELVAEGKSQEEAAAQARQEREDRQAAFNKARDITRIRNEGGNALDNEPRDLASGLVESALAPLARMAGYPQVANNQEAATAGRQAAMDEQRDKYQYPEVIRATSGAANSLVQMVPGIAASAVASPAVGMGVMSAQFGTQEYSRAQYEGAEAGLAGDELDRYALTQAGIEASIMPIMNKIPGMAGLEGRVLRQGIAKSVMSHPTMRQAIASGATKLTKETAAELTEEVITEVSHGYADATFLDKDVDYKGIIKDTVAQTLMTMGLAEVGQQAGRIANRDGRPPVDPATPPALTPEPATVATEPEKRTLSGSEGTSQPILPEIQAFTEQPSRKKYEAAVKAGMQVSEAEARQAKSEEGRKNIAENIKRGSVGRVMDLAAKHAANPDSPEAQDRLRQIEEGLQRYRDQQAPSAQQEAPSSTVPDDEWESFLQNQWSEVGGSSNGQEVNVEGRLQGNAETGEDGTRQEGRQEGRQESLLSPPAGTQDVATPAESQEVSQPAAHTRDTFEADFRQNLEKLNQFSPTDPEQDVYRQRLEDLYDSNPDWSKEIMNTPSSVGGTDDVRPDQSLPPAADPVFKFQTEKGSTYNAFGDGTTQRNKAARDEPGHEGDYGEKKRSAKTVYVDADASALSSAGLENLGGKSRVAIRDGKATLITWNEEKQQWGASPSSRDIAVHSEPKVGRYPLELWSPKDDVDGHEAYGSMHAGNKITAMERVESDDSYSPHVGYHSGLSRSPADVDAAISKKIPVGVSAYESLTAPMRKKLVDYANSDGNVFFDSGAFTAFKKGKEVDWDKTLFAYHELLTSVMPEKRKNVTIVAPDIVGDHQKTQELQSDLFEKFTPIVELGGNVIIPVQKENGGGELWRHWADASNSFTPEQNDNFIVGVPYNAMAWSQDEVLDFMRSRDKDAKQFSVPPTPFHLLGAGPSKIESLFEAAKAEGLSTEGISADAMPKSISQRKRPAKGAKPPVADSGPKPPTKQFLALPQKSQDLFNKAFETRDVEQLKQMVQKSNVTWFGEFTNRTGVKIPRNQKNALKAVLDWAAPEKPAGLDLSVSGQTRPVPDRENASYVIHNRKPDMIPHKFKAVVSSPSPGRGGFITVSGTGVTAQEAYDSAVFQFDEQLSKRKPKPSTPPETPAQSQTEEAAAGSQSEVKPVKKETPKTPDPVAPAEPPEKTLRGQKILPGMTGRAEEIDRQEFVRKHQSRLLEDVQAVATKETTRDEVLEPIRNIFKAIWNGDLKTKEDLFDTDSGNDLWTALSAAIAKDEPRYMYGQLEDMADVAFSQAFTHRDSIKPKSQTSSEPSESDFKAGIRAEIAKQIAEEEAAAAKKPPASTKPAKTPSDKPKAPRKPRTKTGEKLGKLSEDTGAEARQSFETWLKGMKGMPLNTALGPLNPEMAKMTVTMVRAQIKDKVVKFADLVARVVEWSSPDMARNLSDYLEAAWDILRETNPDLDPAGKVADVLGPEKESDNGKRSEQDDSATDGGSEAAGRPLGEEAVEETETEDVSADDGGRDSGRSGDPSGGRSEQDTSGTIPDGDEGTGSVPASPEGNDRPSRRSGRIDFRITEADQIGVKFSPKERFDKNVEAIKVLKKIESENRKATPDEQKVLAQYVGWGGLKEAFSTRDDQGLREKAILKELLTEKELASARMSVRNAHFTSPEVISAMWEGLTDAGFAGGRITEPAVGIGHFWGLVPESVAAVSKFTGIEMDSISARIAQQLYQTADIQHAPYQNVNVKNKQDLMISNVPFGQYKASDKFDKTLKRKESIHNFFFLKALTNVRPGGVVAFITSRYTMDGYDAAHRAVREKIVAAGGRFVGAVRLPNNAFMGIAKTKVTTDIIFIQKDAGDAQPWINTKEDSGGFIFNEYFHEHPENVLGKIDPKGGTQMGEWGIAPDGHDIGKELARKIAAMPFDRSAMAENSMDDAEVTDDIGEDSDVRDGRLSIRGGKLYKSVGGKLEPEHLWGGERGQEHKFAIIQAMANLAAVRDKLSALETSPIANDSEIERARKLLNTAYDGFVKENGFVHKPENKGLFREDEQLPTLLALEEWDTETKTAKKADVFSKRVQRPPGSDANPTTAEGAAVESYARLGRIDLPSISEWLGKSESQVETELTGWAYKDPATGEWSLKNVYLSGNIAKKLKDAEAAAKNDPAYQKNVEDLKRVLPPRKTAGEIHVRPRSPFVKAEHYVQFMKHMGVNGVLRHDEFTGSWLMDNPHIVDPVKAGPWGVGKKTPYDLLEGLLNNKPPLVWTKDYDGNRKIDEGATQLARAKAKEIEDEFGRWIFSEPERALQIEDGFNETVGAYIEGDWDGSHLTLPGMNINVKLMPHQMNAIWRAIVTGNIMLAHEVGLGKTFIMAAIAMERKRLGLASQQMFVVPNHLLAQWSSEFKALYPSAKLLSLESDQINSQNRRTLMERVKSGRFDAIIVTPEAYKKMPMSNAIVEAKLKEITEKIENTIKEVKKAKGDNKNFVAKLESVLESIRTKMEKMLNDPAKDAGAKFDELGIDAIYVDEAHEYRNLWSMTQMGDISGVGLDGNQKTFDMLLKTDYLNEKTNNRGIVFATGTPIANSISELYSMQRYLQPKTLAEAGVSSFDDWANTFGEAVTDIEVDPTGSGFRSKTRFKEFRNTIALSKIFRQVADVKYAEDVGLDKVRPKLRGGKLQAIQVMPSVGLLAYVRNLVRRLEISKSRSFDKRIDNPLKVTTDGRKAALDMRLVMPEEDGISSKINHAVENVARIHREEEERKGAQLIWVNLGTPASSKKSKKKKDSADAPDQNDDSPEAQMDNEESSLEQGRINAYEDIKQKLIAQGIPENEIAFIHDYDDKDRKRALFQKVREGKVRILISTVKKLATGANIQDRLAAMHFLDPPWKPADIEQALGRAIRRGNKYKDWGGVQGFTYVTRGSFDAYIWQLLENKAKAIKQIMRGESDSVEDTGRIELNADEVKALASSNPKVLELVKVRNDVGQLRAEYYGYMQEQGNLQSQIAQTTGVVNYTTQYLKSAENELKSLPSRDDLPSEFKVTVGKQTYTKRSEIGAALIEAMTVIDSTDKTKQKEQLEELSKNPVKIGSVLGKPMFAGRWSNGGPAKVIIGESNGEYIELGEDATGNGARLFNFFDKKYDEPRALRANIANAETLLESLRNRVNAKWPKSDLLKKNEESLWNLEKELGSDTGKKGELPVVSALTKFALMAEKLGRQEGRPVTFDGKQWIHGDRLSVKPDAVTKEMELEVDREVALMLSDAKETPVPSFFFHETKEAEALRVSAMKAKAELSAIQLMNKQHDKVIFKEWRGIKWGSTPGLGSALTPELLRAIGSRVLGTIRAGVKSFEVMIKEMRANMAEDMPAKEADETLRAVRPNLINSWNSMQQKYDLIPATEAAFETAMSDTVDVELEQATEAAKGESPIAEPEKRTLSGSPSTPPADPATPAAATLEGEEPTIGINKAKRAERRDQLGLEQEDIVNKLGHSFPELDAEAKRVSPGEAEDVFTRIGTGGEAADNASDRDVFIMLNHYHGKQMETKKTLAELEAARAEGDALRVSELESKLNLQVAEEVRLMDIARSAGTAAGRALQAFKALLKEDMSLARLRMRLDAAADGTPTDAQLRKMNELHAKYEAVLKELEAKTKEAEEAIARAEIAERIAAELEANSNPGKTKADRRLEAAWKPFQKAEMFFSVTGALQLLPEFTELAGAYIEKGVETFSDFVEKLTTRFGRQPKPETVPVLQQAWDAAWDKERKPPEVSVEPDHPQSLVNAAKALFRHFLSIGITDTDQVIEAVHNELSKQFPEEVTEYLDTMKAMVDYDKIRTVSQDPFEALAADKRAVVQMRVHLEKMRRGIAPNRIEQRHPITDEQRQHRKMVNEAKRKGGFIVTDPERQASSALAALETRLRHSISDTLNEIATGVRVVPEKTVGPTSDTTEDLQAYLAMVRGMHKDIFGDRTMTQEQRLKAAEAAAVKNEAYWNDRLARAKAGDFSTGKSKPNPVTNAQIDAIKARSELAKAQVQELKELAKPKPDPEAVSDARFLAGLERQLAAKLARIADITARAAKGDFAPERNVTKEKREANELRRKSNQGIRDARIKLESATRDMNEHIEQVRKKNLTYVDLAKRVPGAAWATLRDLKLTGELSFILRQGAPRVFGALVPAGKLARAAMESMKGNYDVAQLKRKQASQGYKQLGRTLARTLKAAFWKTDTELARSIDELKQRPNYVNGTYEAMKLSLHEDGGKHSVAEELFINNLVELAGLALDKRFEGFKGFRDGHPFFTKTAHNLNLANRISNATKVFMNEMRADIADDAVALWTVKPGEMSPAEARSLGSAVNALTGKGDMNAIGMGGEKAQNFLNKIMISAPWLMSRLQVLTLHPFWSKGSTAESRKAAAELYADMAAGVAAYYGLVVLAGMFMADDDEEKPVVEWDSTSSDFMKVRIGKTRLDPLFGLQQIIVLASRIYNDEIKDSRGVVRPRKGFEDDWDLIARFQEGRLHPAIQDIRALKTGRDFMGKPISKTEVLMGAVTPITYSAITDAAKGRGFPAQTALAVWAMAGGGLSTYDPRTKERGDISTELQSIQRKLDNPNTPAAVRESLKRESKAMLSDHLLNAVKYDSRNNGLAKQVEDYKPGGPVSPELAMAVRKEQHDIALRAVESLSAEDRNADKGTDDDSGITTARDLLKQIAPTYQEANVLFTEAYKQRHGNPMEMVGPEGKKRRVTKKSVAVSRARLRAMYQD